MVEIQIEYEGELHCRARHQPSGTEIDTDAPVDNQGRGESFSPTDLVATAVGTCMATVIGIVARQKEVDVTGMKVTVKKEMSVDLPRRISKLEVNLVMPIEESHSEKESFQKAALNCPVHHSIHPGIEVEVKWSWVK